MTPGYRLTANAPLRDRNTFGVQALAPWLIEVDDASALAEVLALPQVADAESLVIGGGSNLLFAGDAPGAVIAMATRGLRLLSDDGGQARVRADAGVAWHPLVMWTLEQGLCGLENLALIPGTAGASPIQNIGAYGTEVGEFIAVVEALDRTTGAMVRLDRGACAFAYRDSVFKQQADRYLVTAVEFVLPRTPHLRLDYAGIGEELGAMGIASPTAREVAEAVIRIRRRKLPDPAVVGNAGSFFKNPIVSQAQADALLVDYPTLPVFRGDAPHNRKLSAAWMIEACGWKGHRDGDAGVSAAHALVLVNHGQASGAALLALARRIADSVHARFGVGIEPEPKIIGARW
ncbi:UDP-N-acetylmuramate dehydrogenase [Pseudoxanthomonas sp. F37]|uniref:UDP-N-acetylmuramate dehydrogenase n=1 Tax=Pseudoxanthomonas TaxID=83618 RepID=UPI001FD0FBAD|nr:MULTISPECIES: UDP-N-acetylmuramate dehydrogenase [Pseudoxanthomonas]UOV05864.1 UDP-N-acetylmuramate dehydrogenase [Pseudoxanthomonas mexicana]UOV07455.1 UDP-N-acetylmuramate dehydrogenase [Pseudoxanthomonas sp. F37]